MLLVEAAGYKSELPRSSMHGSRLFTIFLPETVNLKMLR
jgi:hypothetical protein